MKRANTSLLLIIAVLFLALAGYLGVYAWQALAQPDGTALCLRGEEEFSISLTGIILREEQVLVSQGSWVSITAREGRRVGAGDELGISCSSQGDLQRALRLRQLQRELELVQAVLDGPDSGLDPMSAARDAGQAAQELAACLARGEFGSLRAGALALRTLTLESGPEAARAEETALREELAMLEADGPGSAQVLTAPASGLFSSVLDGREDLSPALLEGLTLDVLDTWLAVPAARPQGACGRLVTGNVWYFAARASQPDAQALEPGDTVTLDLNSLCGVRLPAAVYRTGAGNGEETLLVFSCSQGMRETLNLRFLDQVQAVTRTIQGLRLPEEAVREEAEGLCVYRLSGLMAQRVPVTVLWQGDGTVLVDGEGLEEGAEVLLGGRNLYDGKILDGPPV